MFDIFDALRAGVGSDIFLGGLALGAIGLATALVRLAIRALWAPVHRRLWLTVSFDSRHAAHGHICRWLDSIDAFARARTLSTLPVGDRVVLGPAEGRLLVWIGGRPVWIGRRFEKPLPGQQVEHMTLTVFLGTRALVGGWVAAGAALAAERVRIGPRLHVHRDWGWGDMGEVRRRALSTVVAEDDRLDRVLADLRRFLGAEDWYAARGVPWRRGYLLHGPPGTGKSSAIRALASEAGLDLAMLDLGAPQLTDQMLLEGMLDAPKGALLAIEDVDAAFSGREGEGRLSFSGLLNALDGVGAQEGRAVVMTTNHPERLDPALIRPGRADVHVELGPVGAEAAAALFARFFPGEAALAERFRLALGGTRHPAAALQGWLLAHADDPEAAAAAAGLRPALAAE